ncbi:MAG TPA: NAD(+)/NADH kinase [Egicoccus sp.]|nr:NAD(+)/NADH kinase [Egicoccus sp.]HSK21585.1 NAD(+)/NADH kinase [Egicoccus sp.]
MTTVGVVVNPHAAGDVRRLTSLAPNLQLTQRVNTTARVLAGLAAAGVRDVVAMAEPFDIVGRALELLPRDGHGAALRVVPTAAAVDAAGTRRAAAAMRDAGVACVITVGGDGTVRAVVAGWPGAVVVPVAGGTNNTVALPVVPEAAGLAAGRYARDPGGLRRFVERRTVLDADDWDGTTRIAVADVAMTRHGWTGTHAVWDPAMLVEAVLARSDATLTGLAGLGGLIARLADGEALHLRFGTPGRRLLAPLGPGRFVPVEVRDWQVVAAGDATLLTATEATCTVAFDGERELVVAPEQSVRVAPRAGGLRVLSATRLLRDIARDVGPIPLSGRLEQA